MNALATMDSVSEDLSSDVSNVIAGTCSKKLRTAARSVEEEVLPRSREASPRAAESALGTAEDDKKSFIEYVPVDPSVRARVTGL